MDAVQSGLIQQGTTSLTGDLEMERFNNEYTVTRTGKTFALVTVIFTMFLGAMSQQAMSANLIEEITADERLTIFANAVEQAGLSDMLSQDGPYILFVPSNQAMINEGSAFLLNKVLLTPLNADRLKDHVSYHIVQVEQLAGTAADDAYLPTMADSQLYMARYGDARVINGTAVVTERKETDNGILYIVDRLLFPAYPHLN
jgi:uncharacterized surface protein with fasciclin (FAS1) repeats